MTEKIHSNSFTLSEGIKAIGIGKRGSKSLSLKQAKSILKELQSTRPAEAAIGAFLGALLQKGLTEDEKLLEKYFSPNCIDYSKKTLEHLEQPLEKIIHKIIDQQTISILETETLGDFLFKEKENDIILGMIASILRMRYESLDEYEGLLKSINKTIKPAFENKPPQEQPIIQIADPFNGTDHSYIITPLVTHYLQNQNYRVATLVGRSSGPKFIYNPLDIARKLNSTFLKTSEDFLGTPDFGFFIDQKDISESLDRWVDIRRQIIKRPFLATLERFINPIKADYIIVSAFHTPYSEKMLSIAKRAGYKKIIVIRGGLEGSTSFALMREVKMLCSTQNQNGQYIDHQINYNAKKELDLDIKREEKFDKPSLDKNVKLIQEFLKEGQTDYDLFNWRVKATTQGIQQALDWINQGEKNDC
jgi:anthranilate phosphoribosyltransferase